MKKINIVSGIILVLILGEGLVEAQNMVPKKCYLHLIGSISNEYPIEMNLVKINDTIYGDYSFVHSGKIPLGEDNTGKGIPVYGKMSRGDAFILKELNSTHGSVFKGKFTSSQRLAGTFESVAENKALPFEVSEKYPEGSIAMNVHYRQAVMPLVKKPGSPVAAIQLGMLLPGESANPLISDTLIRLMLVKFTGKRVRISEPGKLLEGIKQVYFENYLATNEGIYNETMASGFNWQSLKFMHVLLNSSHILCFYIDHYAFTGGAHGIQTRHFTIVNLWTGKEVVLKNIFKENTEAQLGSILSEKIHGINHLPTTQSLKDAGFFDDTIKPTDNFYITRDGIGFFYNQYDIAPYAAGSIDVFIPFRELKDLLIEGGITRELSR